MSSFSSFGTSSVHSSELLSIFLKFILMIIGFLNSFGEYSEILPKLSKTESVSLNKSTLDISYPSSGANTKLYPSCTFIETPLDSSFNSSVFSESWCFITSPSLLYLSSTTPFSSDTITLPPSLTNILQLDLISSSATACFSTQTNTELATKETAAANEITLLRSFFFLIITITSFILGY